MVVSPVPFHAVVPPFDLFKCNLSCVNKRTHLYVYAMHDKQTQLINRAFYRQRFGDTCTYGGDVAVWLLCWGLAIFE